MVSHNTLRFSCGSAGIKNVKRMSGVKDNWLRFVASSLYLLEIELVSFERLRG